MSHTSAFYPERVGILQQCSAAASQRVMHPSIVNCLVQLETQHVMSCHALGYFYIYMCVYV